MTFYEAALRVLEEAGAPMNYLEITKRSLDKGLLSHVGKVPEQTMLARLAAQAKRSRDRKLVVTARDTFALSDWMLQEDADALAVTGTIEPNAEESLPPLRPTERHPEPRAEYLRAIGRQAERNRRRDDDGKRKKFPPVPEVAFEVLSEVSGLVPSELIARLKARDLVDELGTLALLEALASDNQERVDQGRRPQFTAIRTETNELQLSVETTPPENAPLPLQTQEAFCKAANLPFENGRVVLRSQRRRDEPAAASSVVASSPEDLALIQTARLSVKDARRAMARVLRKKLSELDTGTFEKACVKLLHANGFRELKVSRRGKDGALLSARKKEGSLELRFAIRIARGSGQVERRVVQDLRRDVAQVSANLGLLLTAGEARNDARSEATASGALVMMWCGDHLSEKFFDAEVGVSVMRVELFEIDDAFFEQAKADADEAQKRRDERHRDTGRREDSEGGESGEARQAEAAPPATPPDAPQADAPLQAAPEGDDEGDDDEEGEEGDEGEAAEGGTPGDPAAAGEGGRRRKRRRRRRRRGGRPDGAPGQSVEGAPQAAAPANGTDAPAPIALTTTVEDAPPAAPPAPTPPAPPSSGEPS